MKRAGLFMRWLGKNVWYILIAILALSARFVSVYFAYAVAAAAVAGIACDIYFRKFKTQDTFAKAAKAFAIKNEVKSILPADFPFPSVVFRAVNGEIIWQNESFSKLAEVGKKYNITEVFSNFSVEPYEDIKNVYEVQIGNRKYIAYKNQTASVAPSKKTALVMLHLVDITKYATLRDKLENSRPVVAIVMIDNYEELIKKCSEAEKSLILANIDRIISEWTKPADGILLRYDRDRYVFFFENENLQNMKESEFDIIDRIKTVCSSEKVSATLSIGIGCDGKTPFECFEYAKLAIDMALSRSGDQVVIKKPNGFEFFGGRDESTEKRTKIRSRVCANVLQNIIKESTNVIVMGHKMSDFDCIGAAVGIVCICRELGKKCNIVLDRECSHASDLLVKRLEKLEEYEDVFITPGQAMKIGDEQQLIVVVDTNRPESTEQPLLLEENQKIAVIDHHRRAASYIKDCVINMHEPSASSASELSAELVEYIVPEDSVLKEEAEAMLAGIYLDTKGFYMKAGEHTFETAAMLKRIGADTVEVKRLFQLEKDELVDKNKIVENAKIYFGSFAISTNYEETSRATAGKAADELLEVAGVKAATVIFKCNKKTLISARSLGDTNVQLIMEKLGGGGNLTNAGAQLDLSVEETEEKLMQAIEEYIKSRENKN